MLKLKDVSKFYYNKGIISAGFTKVSVEFKLGEFVVITGESGSGKSTLLNVLSGMDSYEEGEMYINGVETSHYTEADFEDYRKKYIGNIFQNFNLVNSYTVYQNVELVLLINGYKKKDIKEKINSILKEVDLYRFRRTKVSKLSGGQKQRVAIARALAKETPIIIADEPTGNLDSRSAKSVIEILHKISKDKLVIIVTHNYEQVEEYSTRKIKMHDGRIIEDKVLVKANQDIVPEASKYANISFFSKLRLGLRNTFNIIPKFLLMFLVYFFVVAALLAEYSSFKKADYESGKIGFNNYFQNIDDRRIVLQKNDKSYFTDEDYEKINKLINIDYVVKDDLLLDNSISFVNEGTNLYLYGNVKDINRFTGTVDVGRLSQNENEIILAGNKDDYYISQMANQILENSFQLQNMYKNEFIGSYRIVGIKYEDVNQYNFYCSNGILQVVRDIADNYYSSIEFTLSGKKYKSEIWNTYMQIEPNENVSKGAAYASGDLDYLCSNYSCRNKTISITNSNMYYELSKDVKITRTYSKNNFTSLTGLKKYDEQNGKIFVNPDDYQELFNSNYFQSSVFVKDVKKIDSTDKELQDLGYKTLLIKDTLANWDEGISQVLRIMQVVVTIVLIIVMFFISYFIIKIILKSRNIYFTTIRILGASKKVSKQLLDIELLTVSNLAYTIIIGFLWLVHYGVFNLPYIKDLMTYISLRDYILIYIILILMTELISSKFSKSIFKKSAMKTFNEVI